MGKISTKISKATQFRSGDEAVKAGRKGGVASGKSRRLARSITEALDAELEKVVTKSDGSKCNGFEAMITALMAKAVRGDIQAARLIVELKGDLNKTKKVEITGKDGEPISVERKQLSQKEARELLEDIENQI